VLIGLRNIYDEDYVEYYEVPYVDYDEYCDDDYCEDQTVPTYYAECENWDDNHPITLKRRFRYGQFEFSDQKDGMVAFWSLKNPEYPDWFFKSECGVTALAFSYHQPSLLAVGFYDGMVAIYDVRTPTDKPMLESGHTSGKHSDPVSSPLCHFVIN
jgi:WD40 repeat protein